jgi:hypothetical protein
MNFKDQKAKQLEEESEALDELVGHELETVYQRLSFLRRTTPLTPAQGNGVVIAGFNVFAARLAVETRQSKDAFLAEMAENFDDYEKLFDAELDETTPDEPPDDESATENE